MSEWQRVDQYYEERGSYRVSAARVVDRWRFTAWRLVGDTWTWLGTFDSAAEAKAVCGESA